MQIFVNEYGLYSKYIQSWTFVYIRLLDSPCENEVTFRGQNICLKCYQSLELLLYFGKGFRSFNAGNIGSVGQRASKLLAVKVGGLKKNSAALAIAAELFARASTQVRVGPGQNCSQSLMDGKFVAL